MICDMLGKLGGMDDQMNDEVHCFLFRFFLLPLNPPWLLFTIVPICCFFVLLWMSLVGLVVCGLPPWI